MDLLAGLAVLALIGAYLYSKRSQRPAPGPLAASPVPVEELRPDALRSAVEQHSRTPAKNYVTTLANGAALGIGYTPGHDRVDVFAPDGSGAPPFQAFEFSLASMTWLTGPPAAGGEIERILRDTFPG